MVRSLRSSCKVVSLSLPSAPAAIMRCEEYTQLTGPATNVNLESFVHAGCKFAGCKFTDRG
jgi:hypothetical protein